MKRFSYVNAILTGVYYKVSVFTVKVLIHCNISAGSNVGGFCCILEITLS